MRFALPQELQGLLVPVRAQRARLARALLACLLAQAATLAALACAAWLAGQAVAGAGMAALRPGFVALAFAAAAAALGRWWQSHAAHDLAFALIETLQLGIYDGLERAAPARVLGRRTGELAAIATADAELMEMFYAHMLGDLVGAVAVPLAGLCALAWLHPALALLWLPFAPALAAAPLWRARRAAAQGARQARALGRLNADVVEGIQAQRELAAFGRQRRWLARMARATQAVGALQRRAAARSGAEQALADAVPALAVLAVASLAGWLVAQGRLDAALLPLAVVLAGAALAPIAEVAQAARRLGDVRAGAQRVLAILRQPARVWDTGQAARPTMADVCFDDVHFGYVTGRPVLRGVSFAIRAGECVALAGPSGAGKTTCAHLLLRLVEPDAGAIRIGGTDLRDLPLATLRALVAVVPQDLHLFDASVADNIRLGRPGASMAEVREAARLARAHGFIAALPQGYGTRCGERGAQLSRGQRQRIAIARALLVDAPILVLDEATASLDARSEAAIGTAIGLLKRRGRTVVLIAHRPSTIRHADRVVSLQDCSGG